MAPSRSSGAVAAYCKGNICNGETRTCSNAARHKFNEKWEKWTDYRTQRDDITNNTDNKGSKIIWRNVKWMLCPDTVTVNEKSKLNIS